MSTLVRPNSTSSEKTSASHTFNIYLESDEVKDQDQDQQQQRPKREEIVTEVGEKMEKQKVKYGYKSKDVVNIGQPVL